MKKLIIISLLFIACNNKNYKQLSDNEERKNDSLETIKSDSLEILRKNINYIDYTPTQRISIYDKYHSNTNLYDYYYNDVHYILLNKNSNNLCVINYTKDSLDILKSKLEIKYINEFIFNK